MLSLFYLLAVFAIMFEALILIMPRTCHKFFTGMGKKYYDDRTPVERFSSWFIFLYLLWAIAGAFTNDSALFIMLILVALSNTKRRFAQMILVSLISLVILVVILLNHFYYKTDIFHLYLAY